MEIKSLKWCDDFPYFSLFSGQYQILKVQQPPNTSSVAAAVVSNSPQIVRNIATNSVNVVRAAPTIATIATANNSVSAVSAVTPAAAPSSTTTTPSSIANRSSPATPASSSGAVAAKPGGAGAAGGAASGGGAAGGMNTQMTPDTAKHKCKNFLATLLKLAGEQPPQVATNVRNLIQGLIDNKVDPETFTTQLQRELNSSPQPCLIPFLRRSLPYLQQSLLKGELTIDGVRAPPRTIPLIIRGVTTTVQRPPIIGSTNIQRPVIRTITTPTGSGSAAGQVGLIRAGMTPKVTTLTPGGLQTNTTFVKGTGTVAGLQQRVGALNNLTTPSTVMSNQQMREKKSSNSYSVTGKLKQQSW